MTTFEMALPIRRLSANMHSEAVATKQAVWKVAETPREHTWATKLKLRAFDRVLGRLIVTMDGVVSFLSRDGQMEQFSPESSAKIADDLTVGVQLTRAALDAINEALCPNCLAACADRLQRVRDLNEHLDSFAESLHLAADDDAMALMSLAVERLSVPLEAAVK